MVTNSTMETINYVKDIEIEYNIKLIILCIILLYSLASLYIGYKWKTKELWTKIIKIYLLCLPSCVFIVFLPLFVIYLWRTASWELLYGLMIAFYSYAIVVMLIAGNLGFFTWALKLVGLDTRLMNMEMKRKK